jgi:hypothetical protein
MPVASPQPQELLNPSLVAEFFDTLNDRRSRRGSKPHQVMYDINLWSGANDAFALVSAEGEPALHTALRRCPALLRQLRAQKALAVDLPKATWQAKNAAGEDVWFALLRSQTVENSAVWGSSHVTVLRRHVKPAPNARGQGWLVADPNIAGNFARHRRDSAPSKLMLTDRLAKEIALQPELAWGGSPQDHAALARQLWFATDPEPQADQGFGLGSRDAHRVLAHWAQVVPIDSPVVSPELRGLFVAVMTTTLAYIPHEGPSRHRDWDKRKEIASLESSLDAILSSGLPYVFPGPLPEAGPIHTLANTVGRLAAHLSAGSVGGQRVCAHLQRQSIVDRAQEASPPSLSAVPPRRPSLRRS